MVLAENALCNAQGTKQNNDEDDNRPLGNHGRCNATVMITEHDNINNQNLEEEGNNDVNDIDDHSAQKNVSSDETEISLDSDAEVPGIYRRISRRNIVAKLLPFFKRINTYVTNISLLLQLAAGATGLFSQGATAVVHGCSIHALGPKGESSHCRRGVDWSPPVSIMQSLALSTLWSTPAKGHKQAAFHVRFIEKLILEVGVVSQQYSGMQCTSRNTGL